MRDGRRGNLCHGNFAGKKGEERTFLGLGPPERAKQAGLAIRIFAKRRKEDRAA